MNVRRPVVVVGAGGFGREVVDLVRDIDRAGHGLELRGVVDDGSPDVGLLERMDAPFLGPTAVLDDVAADVLVVLAVGDASARERLAGELDRRGLESPVLVHPSAVVGSLVSLGAGTVVAAHCSITTHVSIGRHVHVDRACTVGHDAVLEDFVRLNPGAVVSGAVTVRRGATLGTGAVTRQGVEIGAGTFVGAGAAVVSDLPPHVVAVGVPARPVPHG